MKITNAKFTNFQKKMAKKAIEKGLYEDFGQKELRELKDKYPHLNPGNPTEKYNQEQLAYLENWLMNFDDEMLKRWKTILGYNS